MSGEGKLWVVATPIGNLDDLSPRAQSILRDVDLIAAEDTRHTTTLLRHFNIGTRCVALHEHNEREISDDLVAQLRSGKRIALVSDAGTPLVSDPGFRLVRAAREADIDVSPIPGACAAIAALCVAGLPSDRFIFEGFLAPKSSARRAQLEALRAETRTTIFYESSHRIVETLADMTDVFGGDRQIVLARELTKLFETVIDGTLAAVSARVNADENQRRGEFVLLLAGASGDADAERLAQGRRVYDLLRKELPPGRAAKLAAAISGAPRNALYAETDSSSPSVS